MKSITDGSLFDKATGSLTNTEMILGLSTKRIDYITRDQIGYNYAIKGEVFNDIDRDRFQRFIVNVLQTTTIHLLTEAQGYISEMLCTVSITSC